MEYKKKRFPNGSETRLFIAALFMSSDNKRR
jgi:hypothetical protein